MRHSAWTLWLVPLALPLVLLCVPGSRDPMGTSQVPPSQDQELLQEEDQERPELPGLSVASPQDVTDEGSEALLKD